MKYDEIRKTDIMKMDIDELMKLSSQLKNEISKSDTLIYKYELQIKIYEHQILDADPEEFEFEFIFLSLTCIKDNMKTEIRDNEFLKRMCEMVETQLSDLIEPIKDYTSSSI